MDNVDVVAEADDTGFEVLEPELTVHNEDGFEIEDGQT